jgi:hypothetical protein
MKAALVVLAVPFILVAVALLPLPVRPYLDFQVIYHADMGLLRGIPLYDHMGQVDMIAQLAHVAAGQVFVLPFPYPPWYALSTIWLAWLPIESAARVWFGLNLIMLFMSVWWLTEGLRLAWRLPLFIGAILFVPVLGSLFVGQYTFAVLLGAALILHALRRQSSALTAIAAALLTFKPHLGALVLVIVTIHLWRRKDDFGRHALIAVLAAGVALFVIGFLASPLWPLDYFHSLSGFRDVSQCHQCVSIPMALASLFGGGFKLAVFVAIPIFVAAAAWLNWRWSQLASSASLLVAASLLVTFLVSPYLQNYDYVLLLVPFLVLAAEARGPDWAWLAVAYTLPVIALALYGTAGNISLVLSALSLCGLMARRSFKRAVPALTA